MSVMKVVICSVTCVIALTSCAQKNSEGVRRIAYACNSPAPSTGEPASFRAEVVSLRQNSLHVDFDGFGADFSSIEVKIRAPLHWSDVMVDIYYQGVPSLNGVEPMTGIAFDFKATPPPCLDQPWLFLSDIATPL